MAGRLRLILIVVCSVELSFGTICQYCNKDFNVLGRHVWRCKLRQEVVPVNAVIENQSPERLQSASSNTNDLPIDTPELSIANNEFSVSYTNDPPLNRDDEVCNSNDDDVNYLSCYCGKKCKGIRGLQAHKRACKVIDIPDIRAMLSEPHEDDSNEESNDDYSANESLEKATILEGIKLPSNQAEWEQANTFFKNSIPHVTDHRDVNNSIIELQHAIYNYFKSNHGTVNKASQASFTEKYSNYSNRKLKECLRNLKLNDPHNVVEIKYLSQFLRKRYQKSQNMDLPTAFDHETRLKRNLWKYCNEIFEEKEIVVPEFDEKTCFDHFKGKLKARNRSRQFEFPAWMKSLDNPVIDFDKSPPSYQELTKIIMKMKSRASPCPSDQVSIIVLKKCPIIRTFLCKIFGKCWSEYTFPACWKQGITVLAYKKGAKDDPDNFRPITLEPTMCKIMTSLIRNRLYTFLCHNKYIDQQIQKGFWARISGTIEHTETLSYLINHARNKQRSLVVTLIDLRNAFGEVNHRLLKKVMLYHHIPDDIINLVLDLYSDFRVSIATKEYLTHQIPVKRGVLQGDSLSPLLFNLCFNTLMVTVKSEKLKCLGYIYDTLSTPRQWLQFADDTAIVTSLESDNQLLLNLFTKWVNWADLSVRIDKCHTFGIKKTSSLSAQYMPYLRLCKERVPPTDIGDSFTYLGKQFSFGMKDDTIKDNIVSDLESYVTKIDKLPLHPKYKLRILNTFVYSKLKWPMSIYRLGDTWVKQNCDMLVVNYVRRWLNMHPGANVKHLCLSSKKLGVNMKLPSYIYNSCQISTRRLLKSSNDPNICKLYSLSKSQVTTIQDNIVDSAASDKPHLAKKNCNKIQKQKFDDATWKEFTNLTKQSIIVKYITENFPPNRLLSWQKVVDRMPSNIFSFCRRALILALPTGTNLKIWSTIKDSTCQICKAKPQTQHHILNNCNVAIQQDRLTWRHDSVLHTIAYHLQIMVSKGYELFVDMPGFAGPDRVFESQRPDIVICYKNVVYSVELTICFETNFEKSRAYKLTRYEHLKSNLIDKEKELKQFFIEFSSLGFCSPKIIGFTKWVRTLGVDVPRMISVCTEVCIRTSYYIFNRRNKEWTNPVLLKYH